MNLFGPPNIQKMEKEQDYQGLVKALNYKQVNVRAEAANALGTAGEAINQLLISHAHVTSTTYDGPPNSLVAQMRWAAADPASLARNQRDLAHLRSLAVEPLIQTLQDSSDEVRCAAAKALGSLGDPRAAKPLQSMLNRSNAGVQSVASEALGKLVTAPEVDGTILPIDQYPEYFFDLARSLNTMDEEMVFTRHDAYCENCGVHFSSEALSTLTRSGSRKQLGVNLSSIGVTNEGNNLQFGRCPNCGHPQMKVILRNTPDGKGEDPALYG